MALFNGDSWNGLFGEDEMSESARLARAGEQARAAIFGGDPFLSSPDSEGEPTGGCYNMDYPESWHTRKNEELNASANIAADVADSLRTLLGDD